MTRPKSDQISATFNEGGSIEIIVEVIFRDPRAAILLRSQKYSCNPVEPQHDITFKVCVLLHRIFMENVFEKKFSSAIFICQETGGGNSY